MPIMDLANFDLGLGYEEEESQNHVMICPALKCQRSDLNLTELGDTARYYK